MLTLEQTQAETFWSDKEHFRTPLRTLISMLDSKEESSDEATAEVRQVKVQLERFLTAIRCIAQPELTFHVDGIQTDPSLWLQNNSSILTSQVLIDLLAQEGNQSLKEKFAGLKTAYESTTSPKQNSYTALLAEGGPMKAGKAAASPQFQMEIVQAHKHEHPSDAIVQEFNKGCNKKDELLITKATQVQLNCPEPILKAFQELLKDSAILGSAFTNPYTKREERFPSDSSQLTARHLQILARNESYNVDGRIKADLYNGLLDDNQIAKIRILVKASNVAGIVYATHTKGYPIKRGVKRDANFGQAEVLTKPEKAILIDQAGLQWQDDIKNTGGMFFYPSHYKSPEYSDFQNKMYKAMYGHDRPETPSDNVMTVDWNNILGVIDLNQVANAIEVEFLQALDAAVSQGNLALDTDEKINFKYLKAGMGFFASGVVPYGHENEAMLNHARLKGISQALDKITNLPDEERLAVLGKIKRIELPFSEGEQYASILESIREQVELLGLEWGGAGFDGAFTPLEGFVEATTNCADPHAMPGNEGHYGSVDAMIACNADVCSLNAAVNPHMQLRMSPSHSNQMAPKKGKEAAVTSLTHPTGDERQELDGMAARPAQ